MIVRKAMTELATLVTSLGSAAGQSHRSRKLQGSRLKRLSLSLVIVGIVCALAPKTAFAHTTTVGYYVTPTGGGNGSVTVTYGTYHGGSPGPEGTVNLIGPSSFSAPFSGSTSTRPPGLVDGVNNFNVNTGLCANRDAIH